jgi:hypothetical protein
MSIERSPRRARAALSALLAAACGDNLPPAADAGAPLPGEPRLERAFRSADLPGCTWASPVLVEAAGETRVLVATTEGRVAAYGAGGELRWSFDLPADEGERAWLAATPAAIGDRVALAWQVAEAGGEARRAHRVAVIDADRGRLDPDFPIVTLAAEVEASDGSGPVSFLPANGFSRAALAHGRRAGDELGLVYVAFGNIRDIQPWHGWVFEIDLDAWRAGGDGQAISSVLVTTPERECGRPGESGADDMVCGGGVWSPSGPTLVEQGDEFELWIPTGNGQLDLGRRDYANTVMRVGPGLAFDPSCDAAACAEFDPLAPAEECLASCRDLFVPRLADGDAALAPPEELCDGMTFLECYARLDLDFGASVPAPVVLPSGRVVAVQPAKDGAVYLFDVDHFGAMLDRLVVRRFCGTRGSPCRGHWAGTMVTEPLVTEVDGDPIALIPTFYMDDASPAGVVALDIVEDGDQVRLRERWQAPTQDSPEASLRFRDHTGRLALLELDGDLYAALADPGRERSTDGLLYLLRVSDGAIVDRGELDGPGEKYIEPAVLDRRLFVTSCETIGEGPSHLEGWDLADGAR